MRDDVNEYLDLITWFFRSGPNYMSMLEGVLQPFVDIQNFLAELPAQFDIDTAIGVQLDVVGQWVGRSRYVPVPLPAIWFSFDDPLRGFDVGIWQGPYSTGDTITALDDTTYRHLLYAKRYANRWDGSVAMATLAFNQLFFNAPAGTNVWVEDRGTALSPGMGPMADMNMVVGVSGTLPDLLSLLIMEEGLVGIKPETVGTEYQVTSVGGTPIFGFNVEDPSISGFDVGAWAVTPTYLVTQGLA